MIPGSSVNLQGLLHLAGGFRSLGVSPGNGGHSIDSPSLVEGLRVEAQARALRHASGITNGAALCSPRFNVVAFTFCFHVAALSLWLTADAMQGIPAACSNAMRLNKR